MRDSVLRIPDVLVAGVANKGVAGILHGQKQEFIHNSVPVAFSGLPNHPDALCVYEDSKLAVAVNADEIVSAGLRVDQPDRFVVSRGQNSGDDDLTVV